MSKILTTDKLINSITRRALIPTDQNTFTNQDFIDMVNEEIDMFAVPHLLSTYEEYLVNYIDYTLEADKFEYTIPDRAVGNKLRDASLIDSSGNTIELSRIQLDELSDFENAFNIDFRRDVFFIRDNKLVFVGEIPVTEGQVRMHFYLRPNTLVKEERVGIITSIDRNTGIITLSSFPENFAVIPEMDFISSKSPNKILKFDIQPTSVNANTKSVTFTTTDIPEDLIVGDYLAQREETIVPQLPTELHPILAQRVAVAALEALGDSEGVAQAQRKLDRMEQSVLGIIDDRAEGNPKKIRNRYSHLRNSSRSRLTRSARL